MDKLNLTQDEQERFKSYKKKGYTLRNILHMDKNTFKQRGEKGQERALREFLRLCEEKDNSTSLFDDTDDDDDMNSEGSCSKEEKIETKGIHLPLHSSLFPHKGKKIVVIFIFCISIKLYICLLRNIYFIFR